MSQHIVGFDFLLLDFASESNILAKTIKQNVIKLLI